MADNEVNIQIKATNETQPTFDTLAASIAALEHPLEFLKGVVEGVVAEFKALNSEGPSALGSVEEKSHSLFATITEGVVTGELLKDALEKVGEVGVEAFEKIVEIVPEMIEHVVHVGNELYEMSLKTGASVENLSALRYVASQTGISFESFGTTLFKMEAALGATGTKGETLSADLAKIGLSMRDLKNESPDEAFIHIAEALEKVENNADKNKLAMEIFGRGAKEMAGLFHEDIDEMIREAEELGLIMDTKTAAAAHVVEISWKTLGMQFEAVSNQLAAQLLPALATLEQLAIESIHRVVESADGFKNLFGSGDVNAAVIRIGEALIQATAAMAGFAQGAIEGLKDVTAFAVRTGEAIVNVGYAAIKATSLGTANEEGKGLAAQALRGLHETYDSLELLKTGVNATADVTSAAFGAMEKVADGMAGRFGEAFKKTEATIEHFAETSHNAAGGMSTFGENSDKFAKAWTAAFEDVQKLWGQAEAAETASADKGLQATLDRLNKQEIVEKAHWDKRLETGKVSEDLYWQAIEAIDERYDALRETARQQDADKQLKLWQKNEDDIQKIRDAAFAAESQTNIRGLDLQLATLDKQEQAEKDSWTKRRDAGQIYDDQYWEAIEAIDDKFEAEREKKTAAWEDAKWKAIGDIERQALSVETSLLGDSVQAKLAANEKELQSKIATLQLEGKLDEDYLDALKRLYADKAQAIILSNDPVWQAWKKLNADMRTEWANTWEQALTGQKTWVEAALDPFRELWKGISSIFAGILADVEAQFMSPLLNMIRQGMGSVLGGLGSGAGVGATAGGGGLGGMFGGLLGGAVGGPNWSTYGDQWWYGDNGQIVGNAGEGMTLTSGLQLAGGLVAANGISGLLQPGGGKHSTLSGLEAGAGIGTMIMPGLGTLIGGGIGALGGWIRGMFGGPSKDELSARDSFAKIEQPYGSIDAMNTAVGDAYSSIGLDRTQAAKDLGAVLDATHKSSKDVEAAWAVINQHLQEAKDKAKAVDDAIKDLTGAMNATGNSLPDALRDTIRQLAQMPGISNDAKNALLGLANTGPNFKQLEATAKEYGLTLKDLGPKFQQAHVTDEATKIIDDFTNLNNAGAEFSDILGDATHGIGKSINAVVQESLKFKTTVPENMRPMIQALIDNGQLLDENGKKITDISAIKFGEPIKTGVDKIVDAITHLSDILTGKLVDAAKTAAGDVNKYFGGIHPPNLTPQPYDPHVTPGPAGPMYPNAPAPSGEYAPAFGSEAYVRQPTLAIVGDAVGGEFVLRAQTVNKWLEEALRTGVQAGIGGWHNGQYYDFGMTPPGGAQKTPPVINICLTVNGAGVMTEGDFQGFVQRAILPGIVQAVQEGASRTPLRDALGVS